MVREQYQRMYGFMHPDLKVSPQKEAKGYKFKRKLKDGGHDINDNEEVLNE